MERGVEKSSSRVSQTVEAANRRTKVRSATDGQGSSYTQGGTDRSRSNTGGRPDPADNREVTVNSSERSDRNTFTHQRSHNNTNNYSGSNSSDDEDDRSFYTNYVSRMQNTQYSQHQNQSNYDNANVNTRGWGEPNLQSDQPYDLPMREYPPLSRQIGATSFSGKSGDYNTRAKSNNQSGPNNGNQNRQSAAFSGTSERPQQSRDGGGGDRGSK